MENLYARINKETNQMVGSPSILPTNYQIEGTDIIITNFNKLPDETLCIFGWIPVITEENTDPLTYYVSSIPTYNTDKKCFELNLVPRDLKTMIEEYKNNIDFAASSACAKYITVGAGQEMRYLEKVRQAREYLNADKESSSFNEDDYRMIIQEAEACNMSVEDKAQEVLSTTYIWSALAAKVESIRISAKKLLDNEGITAKELLDIKNKAVSELGEI